MTNPFFVLTSIENEIIGVIHNPSIKKVLAANEKVKAYQYALIKKSVVNCLEHHYDLKCNDITIPSDFADFHKPIEFRAYMGEDTQEAFDGLFTLTMAWYY